VTRLVLPLSLLFVLLVAGPVAAQPSRSFSWERFDVSIELLPDSTLRVVETQQVHFNGTHRSFDREIPLANLSSITEVEVGETGRGYRPGYNQPETFGVGRGEDRLRIDWWFEPTTNATRTFELRYRVSGAIRVYQSGDQLTWTAVPAAREADVLASAVLVRLPLELPPEQVAAKAYLGSRETVGQPSVGPREIRFESAGLSPGQAYQVRLEFPHRIVDARPPPWQAAYDRQVWLDSVLRPLNLLVVLAAVGVVGLTLVFWRLRGGAHDRAVAAPPSVAEMPGGLAPAVVGMLVDERADIEDALATLLSLADRGVIRMSKTPDADRDYSLELLQEPSLGLRPYERTLIGALFRSHNETRLSELKDRWTANAWLFERQVLDEAVQQGLFRADARRPRRTRTGKREAARWLAFGQHLSRRGYEHRASPEELARQLPYALALGILNSSSPGGAATTRSSSEAEGRLATTRAAAAQGRDGLYEMIEAASEALPGGSRRA
jgi:Predicted membrane protein (DUF2207)